MYYMYCLIIFYQHKNLYVFKRNKIFLFSCIVYTRQQEETLLETLENMWVLILQHSGVLFAYIDPDC